MQEGRKDQYCLPHLLFLTVATLPAVVGVFTSSSVPSSLPSLSGGVGNTPVMPVLPCLST